jgi:mycothiol synthase
METRGATPKAQLQMVWPRDRLNDPPKWTVPEAYALRTFHRGDEDEHIRLMRSAGFKDWNADSLDNALPKCLPDGFFVIHANGRDTLVATAMAIRNPIDLHRAGGELGWVAADPEHRGRGLGLCVCAAVTSRFLDAGYTDLYLRTDDFRLPAIRTYLKLGWIPFLFAPDMEERWRAVCRQLGLGFDDVRRVVARPADSMKEHGNGEEP